MSDTLVSNVHRNCYWEVARQAQMRYTAALALHAETLGTPGHPAALIELGQARSALDAAVHRLRDLADDDSC